jgi:hypothetical protein
MAKSQRWLGSSKSLQSMARARGGGREREKEMNSPELGDARENPKTTHTYGRWRVEAAGVARNAIPPAWSRPQHHRSRSRHRNPSRGRPKGAAEAKHVDQIDMDHRVEQATAHQVHHMAAAKSTGDGRSYSATAAATRGWREEHASERGREATPLGRLTDPGAWVAG